MLGLSFISWPWPDLAVELLQSKPYARQSPTVQADKVVGRTDVDLDSRRCGCDGRARLGAALAMDQPLE